MVLLAHHRRPVRRLIHDLKYRKRSAEAEFVAEIMVGRLDKKGLAGFVVAAVPLHFTRELGRGFNQAELVGRALADRLGLHYYSFLERRRMVQSQVDLDKGERSKNVRYAFAVRSQEGLKGARVLLLDDVITTGATVRECGKVLKRAGAQEVWAVALGNG